MRGKALWLGISLATIGCAAHAQTTRVEADKTVAGHDIQLITAASGIGVNVVIDGQMFESDGDDMYDSIFGTYDVGGTPVVLIEHGDGGNACPGTFTALILGSPITTTKMFGSCSDVPAVSVNGAQLIVSTPQMNGQGTEVDVVTKDGLNATETVAEQLIGPAYTPGMDLAAALSDPPAGVPYHTKAAVEKLKAVLGDDLYSTVCCGQRQSAHGGWRLRGL